MLFQVLPVFGLFVALPSRAWLIEALEPLTTARFNAALCCAGALSVTVLPVTAFVIGATPLRSGMGALLQYAILFWMCRVCIELVIACAHAFVRRRHRMPVSVSRRN
jgi:EamA domain-containing membrane protein RarD